MTVESSKRADRDYEHPREWHQWRQLRTELPQDSLLITKDEIFANELRRCLPFSEAICCLPCSIDSGKRALAVGSKTISLHEARFMILQLGLRAFFQGNAHDKGFHIPMQGGLNRTRVAYEKVTLQMKVFSGSLAILQRSLHSVASDEP
jgi:hypothetical protein